VGAWERMRSLRTAAQPVSVNFLPAL
jgi:hypothetical protein